MIVVVVVVMPIVVMPVVVVVVMMPVVGKIHARRRGAGTGHPAKAKQGGDQ
jgi:hypothetical protein